MGSYFTIVLELEYTVLLHSTLCVDRQDVNTRSNPLPTRTLNLPGDSIGGDVHTIRISTSQVASFADLLDALQSGCQSGCQRLPTIDSITICPAHPSASGTSASLLGTRSLTCLVQPPAPVHAYARTHLPHITLCPHLPPLPPLPRAQEAAKGGALRSQALTPGGLAGSTASAGSDFGSSSRPSPAVSGPRGTVGAGAHHPLRRNRHQARR